MNIISFEYLGEIDGSLFGEIEVKEWFFFKRKLKVFRPNLSTFWRFLDTGKYTPAEKIEEMHLVWIYKQKLKELNNDSI